MKGEGVKANGIGVWEMQIPVLDISLEMEFAIQKVSAQRGCDIAIFRCYIYDAIPFLR